MSVATSIAEAIKEGLSLWKTFISTREEAYKRKMDKKLRIALNIGEEYIRVASKTSIGRINKELKKLEERFFKYNN